VRSKPILYSLTHNRLRLAGCDRELFPRDAVALLHEASEGAHRELDRLAQLCLRDAARLKRKLVDGELVRGVLDRAQLAA
jgi:type II secretory pathway predicted ATPase ExeA